MMRGKKGLPLNDMDKADFQNWVGNENVVDGKIKVYRGIKGKDTRGLQPGDMVTLSKEYAKEYGENVLEFNLPVEGLGYFSGVKGGNPKKVGQTLSGAQPTEFVWQGTKQQLTEIWNKGAATEERKQLFKKFPELMFGLLPPALIGGSLLED